MEDGAVVVNAVAEPEPGFARPIRLVCAEKVSWLLAKLIDAQALVGGAGDDDEDAVKPEPHDSSKWALILIQFAAAFFAFGVATFYFYLSNTLLPFSWSNSLLPMLFFLLTFLILVCSIGLIIQGEAGRFWFIDNLLQF